MTQMRLTYPSTLKTALSPLYPILSHLLYHSVTLTLFHIVTPNCLPIAFPGPLDYTRVTHARYLFYFMGGTTNGIACDTMGQPHLICCYPDRSRLGSDHRNKRKPTRHASPSQPLQCDNPHTSRANEQPLLLRADERNSDERRKRPPGLTLLDN
jgi:hypothetical protein